MSWARPSTTAVLPTPGSPIRIGLFLVRRDSTCMTRSISLARPMTGSSLPSRAAWVRLRPNWSSTSEPDGVPSCGHPVVVGAELDQHLRRDALTLADEAEQDVLGADVVVAELERLAQGQLEDLLGPGGEGNVAGWSLLTLADDLLDLLTHCVEGDTQTLECLGSDTLALVDQAEQDVLGPDVVVVEHARLFLRQHHNPTGPVGEPFEHRYLSSLSRHLDAICAARHHGTRRGHLMRDRDNGSARRGVPRLESHSLMFAHGVRIGPNRPTP